MKKVKREKKVVQVHPAPMVIREIKVIRAKKVTKEKKVVQELPVPLVPMVLPVRMEVQVLLATKVYYQLCFLIFLHIDCNCLF